MPRANECRARARRRPGCFRGSLVGCAGLLLISVGGIARAADTANVMEDLIAHGVTIEGGERLALPAPQMPDGLDARAQSEALGKAAGKYPLDRFTRNAVVAPFALDITSAEDASGKRRGQRVDFCFVAYGTIDAILDKNLFGELAGAQESRAGQAPSASVRALTGGELRARGLARRQSADFEEAYVLVDVPILDRVQLRGVGFGQREKRARSVVAAMVLDERFRDDPDFPNCWRPITRDEQGRTATGTATPHSGLGGYIKITPLQEPEGALFVECHVAFDEPEAWFGGKNLLRSKLPLVIQDNVRTFRRKLAKDK